MVHTRPDKILLSQELMNKPILLHGLLREFYLAIGKLYFYFFNESSRGILGSSLGNLYFAKVRKILLQNLRILRC